jgi:hypothetical protein
MTTNQEIKPYGASTKRMTTWNGMQVGFNKARTIFIEYTEVMTNSFHQMDSNGGRVLMGRELTLTDAEREDLLATWRAGKAAWYQETTIPLRSNAAKARQHFTA